MLHQVTNIFLYFLIAQLILINLLKRIKQTISFFKKINIFFLFVFKAEVKPTPTAAVMEIKQEGPIIVKASKDKKKINQRVSKFF